MHPRAHGCQRREDVRVGMPVRVLGPDADEGHRRIDRREERRLGGPGAVVRHGEHVGAQLVRTLGQQAGLRLALDVPGQEHARPPMVHPQHQGGLVALARRVPVRPTGRGMQDLDGQVTDADGRALHRGPHGRAASRRRRPQLDRSRGLRWQRHQPHGPHTHPPDHLGGPAEMIEVGVGHHQGIEVTSAVLAQPPRGGAVGTGVDQDPGPGRLDQERVALADVDRRHPELGRWQAAGDRRQRGRDERDDQDQQGQPTTACPLPRQQPHRAGTGGDQRDRTRHVDRAAVARQRLGDPQHDGGPRSRHREAGAGETDVHDRERRADEGQRGPHHRGRHGQEVRRKAHEVELTEGRQQHRQHGQLRPDGDPDQRRQAAWHPGRESVAGHRREQQHAGGRRRGQDQPEGGGQAGVEQDEQQDDDGQGVAGIPDLSAHPGEQEHQRHRSSPQHTGLETRQEGEPGHDRGHQQPPCPDGQAEHPGRGEHP